MNWPLIFLQSATATVMIISLFGLLIPIYPGLTVIWAASLVYGILVGFKAFGWVAWLIFAIISVLTIFGNVIDNIITSKKAYDSGASIWSVIVSLIAGVIGAIIWTPIGGLLVAPIALFLAEYYRAGGARRRHRPLRGGGGARRAVPHLPGLVLEEAFEHLARGRSVLGPSDNGGYYLIGLQAPCPELFRDIAWGGPTVLADTLARARAAGLEIEQLPTERAIESWIDLYLASRRLEALQPYV